MAEKINASFVVQNVSDDFLGDKVAGVFTFPTEGAAKSAAKNAGPSFSVRRIRMNSGDIRK